MHSALSPKCKIDSLRVESLRRKKGKGHGFCQVPNSSSAVGTFCACRRSFWGCGGEGREAPALEYEKRDPLSRPWFWQREGKVGREDGPPRVVISWRPPLRQSLFLAIFHLLSLRLFVPPISPAIYSFLAPALQAPPLPSPAYDSATFEFYPSFYFIPSYATSLIYSQLNFNLTRNLILCPFFNT